MFPKLFLLSIVSFGAISETLSEGSKTWNEPWLELSPEALQNNITISSSTDDMTIDIPEFDLGNDFNLGQFDFTGGNVNIFCRALYSDGNLLPIQNPFLPNSCAQGSPLLYLRSVDYESEFEGKNVVKFFCELTVDDASCPDCKKLNIFIKNVNDLDPKFNYTYPSKISFEEMAANATVMLFEAEDPDKLGALKMRLESVDGEDVSNFFSMVKNTDSSYWLSIKNLDYETQNSYQLSIILEDTKDDFGNVLTNKKDLEVKVIDVQDTPPIWKKMPQNFFKIDEHSPVNTPVFTMFASDGDVGVSVKNPVEYKILKISYEGSDAHTFLGVNSEGGVFVKEDVDLEKIGGDGIFEVEFQAVEMNCNSQCESETVTSVGQIVDINDNLPEISSTSLSIDMPENTRGYIHQLFGDILVSDMDSSYQLSTYNIRIQNPSVPDLEKYLEVQPRTGSKNVSLLLLSKVENEDLFDFEKLDVVNFDILIEETSDASRNDKITLTINLQDVNDNAPVFEEDNYSVSISEDLSDLKESTKAIYNLLQVKAYDLDKSDKFGNKSLRYSLGTTTNIPISIDPITGEIILNVTTQRDVFDFETSRSHEFQLTAEDCYGCDPGLSSPSAISIFTIIVKDVNDKSPKISPSQIEACTYENDPTSWPEEMTDECLTSTPLGSVEFVGSDDDTMASLHLDIDWDKSIGRKDFKIVTDKSKYISSFTVEATSGEGTNSIVGKLKPGPDFIDREEVDEIILQVRVTDSNTIIGEASTSVSITITIVDIDDTAPEFSDDVTGWNFSIDEYDANLGEIYINQILRQTIRVTDKDVSQQFFFSLEDDSVPEGLIDFAANPQNDSLGQLQVKNYIDREDQDINANGGKLLYTLTVSDAAGNSITQEISVNVIDLNDCIPEFSEESYSANVKEDTEVGTSVLKIVATDKDITEKFRTIFFPPLQTDIPFVIDSSTGVISISKQLDYESNYKTFSFSAIAKDSIDGRSNSNSVTVSINLEDVNDNAPIVTSPPIQPIRVANTFSTSMGTVYTFAATDKDSGDNGKVTFTSENLNKQFELNSNGELRVIESLENLHESFQFQLIVKDLGDPPMESDPLNVTIDVYDENDRIPIFQYPPPGLIEVLVDINSEPGSGLVDIYQQIPIVFLATDDDTYAPYKTVNYKIVSEDPTIADFFEVKIITGGLFLRRTLEKDLYSITVEAYDNPNLEGGVQRKERVTLSIKTTKNVEPIFKNQIVSVEFLEGPLDTLIPQRLPDAIDLEDFIPDSIDLICYYILEDTKEFVLEKSNGTLLPANPLDREVKEKYQIRVLASNNCQSKPQGGVIDERSILNVTVTVIDINDEEPVFDKPAYQWSMSVDEPAQWIRDIVVVDKDREEDLDFSITEIIPSPDGQDISQLNRPFVIEKTGGLTAKIQSGFTPTDTMSGYFTFSIEVKDKGKHIVKAPVKIVMIAKVNQVLITFDNSSTVVVQKKEEIKAAFELAFDGWVFTIDSISATSRSSSSFNRQSRDADDQTLLNSNFVEQDSFSPVHKIDVQAKYDVVHKKLVDALSRLELVLDQTTGIDVGSEIVQSTEIDIPQGISLAAVIVGLILLIIVVFLAIAYKIRVSHLERRVKATMTPIGPQGTNQSNLDVGDDDLPGTNANANKGSNPLWDPDGGPEGPKMAYLTDLDMRNSKAHANYRMNDDDIGSLSSGDEIFIGVEDQDEFVGYKEALDEIDNLSDSGSLDSDLRVQPKIPHRRHGQNISIFLRPAYEDGHNIRQNPLYNDESAL